ncbi:tetratricopeptide repeat protein [Deinococcus maricopensis]|uniref:Tetratricopeptide TPR_1 repeat-containing protein n=1 Tax=Deinococcus maricopensis (strain DSM 21211 / LMG 22137 / NRRL B-23946 / LB-34) TaxID=709986 RepID=E8U6D4_DEIML|nr:tetratricopeptide repeat protein [Deinococcus maricopensis]ADV66623.1 Tetratricopeptide TPR_1 repeat-containing protein [Deinococcus maricopensis DSM 21211]
MIDPELTWQQAADALASEDFDSAYAILEGAEREAARPQRARILLYLASVDSLYGDDGVTDAQTALRDARTADSGIRHDPLYMALMAEIDGRVRGPDAAPLPDAALSGPPLARYHALAALALTHQPERALDVEVSAAELPAHLRWRLRSWQADCEEQLGRAEQAAHLYAEAAHAATGMNRAIMFQDAAALHLQAGQHEQAGTLLGRARLEYRGAEGEALHLAGWHHLDAQVKLARGDLQAALTGISEASRLERANGDPSYGVELVWGQTLTQSNRHEEALAHFTEALRLASAEDRPYALHELGVTYLDLDRPLEAMEALQQVLAHDEYPYAPEVLADLAECEYRLGRLAEAEANAQQAYAQGATVPASIVLGNIAMDYYHLPDALEHYERVVREAAPGSRDWTLGHQMAADVMAQQGFPDPAAAYAHAQQALEHLDPSDEWHTTLREHAQKAEERLQDQQGRGRTLN